MASATVARPTKNIRMTLTATEFLREYGGRLPAGTVVLVDEETAERWREFGIATDSAETDLTLKEQKAAQIKALQAELEAIEEHGSLPVDATRVARAGRKARGR